MSRRFRLDIAYDGTDFAGWQSQSQGERTVQQEIEKALKKMMKADIPIVGAGRTDSGVHARCQTAHFEVEHEDIEGGQFTLGLNSLLPRDLRILHCQQTTSDFHSRYSALARVYHYHLLPSASFLPWEDRYCHRINFLPPLSRLNEMAASLFGEMDFTTFSQAKDANESRRRYIYHASFFPQGDKVIFKIAGNAFLWKMVRSLVGSLLDFAERGWTSKEFLVILNSQDRKQAGPTAPAKGLFLQKVIYDAHEFAF